MPSEISFGDKLAMTMRILVKVTTPVKLNLITQEGHELISPGDKDSKEVHFV